MTIKYIANDGTEFADKLECIAHEYKQKHQMLSKVEFYNRDHEKLDSWKIVNPYNEVFPNMDDVYEIIIPEEAVEDFQKFAWSIYFGRSDCKSWEAGTYRYAFDTDDGWIFTKISK